MAAKIPAKSRIAVICAAEKPAARPGLGVGRRKNARKNS